MLKRLILHVGLPKTGTTAFQLWCHRNRDRLLREGVWYPELIRHPADPSHLFVTQGIRGGDLSLVESCLRESPCDTVLVSHEGLSGALFAMQEPALRRFRDICAGVSVEVLVVHREPESWLRSFWKQYLINPQQHQPRLWARPSDTSTGVAASGDCGTMTLEEFRAHPRVQGLLDRQRVSVSLANAYGAHRVSEFEYEAGLSPLLRTGVGVNVSDHWEPETYRVSISDDLAELIRLVNGLGVPIELRDRLLGVLAIHSGDRSTLRVSLSAYRPEALAAGNDLSSLVELMRWIRSGESRGPEVWSVANEVCRIALKGQSD